MRCPKVSIAWVCVAFSLMCVPRADAQVIHGGVRGVVRDSYGVVPGAEVAIIDDATNVVHTAMTNEIGEYGVAGLAQGTYTVRVALPGFATEERTGLRLGQLVPAAIDFILDTGGLSQPIVVAAEESMTEFDSALQ